VPIRPDPLKQLLDLQERMNRLFEETLGRERFEEPALLSGGWVPLADCYETPEAFVVEVELPGTARKDVEIRVEGDELLIRGVRQPTAGARPDAFHRLERRHGAFARSFRLADEVDPERITAELRDGLLRLEVPRTRPRPSARVVRVERAD
jgi:HSP20 family protein